MEKLNDILSNVKERLSNPLIFSFICSWLIINWPITISLFCAPIQIEKEGAKSIFDFIDKHLSVSKGLLYPLFAAIGYTLLIPVVKNLIKALNAWAFKWGENWNLKILKDGGISINKYLGLRAEYEKRTAALTDVIKKESGYLQDYARMEENYLTSQQALNNAKQELHTATSFMAQLQDASIINGFWDNNYVLEDGTKGFERIFIENSMYYIVSPLGIKEEAFTINNFFYDNRYGTVCFVKHATEKEKARRQKKEQHHIINQLKFDNANRNMMSGTENETIKIAYTRK